MNQRIYLDMDGVIADFVGGSLRAHGKVLPKPECRWDFMMQVGFAGGGDPSFWDPLSNPDFWANLDVLDDGAKMYELLLREVPDDRICVLSSGLCPGSADGKRAWLKRHFPAMEKTAIFGTVKHMAAAPCKILVDDHTPNVDGFALHGGRTVLVPRPWNHLKGDANGNFDPVVVTGDILRSWNYHNSHKAGG